MSSSGLWSFHFYDTSVTQQPAAAVSSSRAQSRLAEATAIFNLRGGDSSRILPDPAPLIPATTVPVHLLVLYLYRKHSITTTHDMSLALTVTVRYIVLELHYFLSWPM